jgi:hypothetical protein
MLHKVRESLLRHFQVLVDEEYMWRSYNEYAVRYATPLTAATPLSSMHI